jgi:multiple sugar transport system ATP-binding protein
MVYVTHDQIEAQTLADRVVIMKDGDIQQIGSPLQVYADPANLFVANFIGMPPMNVFTVQLDCEGNLRLASDAFAVTEHPAFEALRGAGYCGRELVMGVRPEHIQVLPADASEGFDTVCDIYELLGSEALVHFAIGDASVVARIKETEGIVAKRPMRYRFDVKHVFFFDKDTGVRIHE